MSWSAAHASTAASSPARDPCPMRRTPSVVAASMTASAGPASAAWAVRPSPAAAAIWYEARYGAIDG